MRVFGWLGEGRDRGAIAADLGGDRTKVGRRSDHFHLRLRHRRQKNERAHNEERGKSIHSRVWFDSLSQR